MLSLLDAAAVEAALHQPHDSELLTILSERLAHIRAQGLSDLTHIVVVQAHDTERDIDEAIGWSPLVHPIDEVRFDEGGFEPYWAWLRDLGGWYELIHPIGNDGFAYIVLIEKGDGPFAAMCGGNL